MSGQAGDGADARRPSSDVYQSEGGPWALLAGKLLRVAIDVLAAFSCLVVRLQAVAHAAQKLADNRRANLMTLLRQLLLARVLDF